MLFRWRWGHLPPWCSPGSAPATSSAAQGTAAEQKSPGKGGAGDKFLQPSLLAYRGLGDGSWLLGMSRFQQQCIPPGKTGLPGARPTFGVAKQNALCVFKCFSKSLTTRKIVQEHQLAEDSSLASVVSSFPITVIRDPPDKHSFGPHCS